jgi:hypothetical protein
LTTGWTRNGIGWLVIAGNAGGGVSIVLSKPFLTNLPARTQSIIRRRRRRRSISILWTQGLWNRPHQSCIPNVQYSQFWQIGTETIRESTRNTHIVVGDIQNFEIDQATKTGGDRSGQEIVGQDKLLELLGSLLKLKLLLLVLDCPMQSILSDIEFYQGGGKLSRQNTANIIVPERHSFDVRQRQKAQWERPCESHVGQIQNDNSMLVIASNASKVATVKKPAPLDDSSSLKPIVQGCLFRHL